MKNINPLISTKDIKQFLDRKFNQNSKSIRFHSSVKQKPLPIIRISCHSEISSNLLTESIDIFGKHYHCDNTKSLLFIVLTVKNLDILLNTALYSLYHNCGNQKHQNKTCCNPSRCVNCYKEGNPSTSSDCPTFLPKKSLFKIKLLQFNITSLNTSLKEFYEVTRKK